MRLPTREVKGEHRAWCLVRPLSVHIRTAAIRQGERGYRGNGEEPSPVPSVGRLASERKQKLFGAILGEFSGICLMMQLLVLVGKR